MAMAGAEQYAACRAPLAGLIDLAGLIVLAGLIDATIKRPES